jgi:CheY-like chemotaxis protein
VDIITSIESALEAIRPAADAKQITIVVEREPYATVVTGDADRLQQVFWNLLSNAVKFTPRNGRVEVKISRFDSQLGITVSDTGAGISREFLPFIFERFTQADTTTARRHAGLGLGLSIVRHIVELHGGTVTAESEGVGKGSSFRIALPVRALHRPEAEAPARQVAINTLTEEITLDEVRVLVVDDEAETRELLKIILASHRAEVMTSASAAEALPHLDDWKPNVLVSDIGMPVLDGYAFIKRVRSLNSEQRDIPAIALTAYARAEDRMRALAAGFQMHVPKPVEASELVMVIASLVKRI